MAVGASAQLNAALAGRYRVEREIGQGGMATVYLAHDLRHQRRVALKVLNPELGAVLGVERFLAEIRVTANLQHPNLLPLFDSGEADGLLFYVMPYVEGESLRVRLEREKQLPIDEAVRLAVAVASALDYAHRHDVIHRDLKPENILLHEGQPLVSDFGIALAVSNAGGNRVTQTGISLGTPQYMSPEQATGDRQIDGRSDIYSLGAVLYEMLTGEPPHSGTTAQAIIAKVLTDRPRSVRLSRDTVPEHVEMATERALAKLPADRWATGHEFADALQGRSVAIPRGVITPGAVRSRRLPLRARMRDPVVLGLTTALVVAVAAAVAFASRRSASDDEVMRVSLAVPAAMLAAGAGGRTFDISADGRTFIYDGMVATGGFHVFLRRLDDLQPRELSGVVLGLDPTISPDGRWIVYTSGAQLYKVPTDGGTPVAMGPALLRGTTWVDNSTIAAAREHGIWLYPASGGAPRPIATADTLKGERGFYYPVASADGRYVFFQAVYAGGSEATRIGVASVKSGESRMLDVAGIAPIGMIDDALIFSRLDGAIMAVRMDLPNLRTRGLPIPLGEQTSVVAGGVPRAALSRSGSLIYQRGALLGQLALVDSVGVSHFLLTPPKSYVTPRYSPDGSRIALAIDGDIWIYNIASNTPQRLTTFGRNDRPEWTPDGKRVLYRATRDGEDNLWWQNADGSDEPRRFARVASGGPQEGLISPDGKWAVLRTVAVTTKRDIYYRAMSGDTTLHPLAATEFEELMPRVSPDGNWIAYISDESGSNEVYVRRFPGPSGKVRVSDDGGTEPLWAPNGKRIYYRRGSEIIAATLAIGGSGASVSVIERRKLFDGPYITSPIHANYDVTPDGKHFLMVARASQSDAEVILIHNWGKEVRERLRAAR